MSEWKNRTLRPDEQPGYTQKVPISRIESKTAKEIFGEQARRPTQTVVKLFAMRDDSEMPIGTLYVDQDVKNIDPRSFAGKYNTKYQGAPKIGKMVEVRVTKDGFWEIVL